MRRVLYAAIAAFAVVFTVADAYSCTYNGASLAGIPLTNPPLQIPQVVPSDHTLDGIRYWQFSLCTATPYSGCSQPAGYVVEINGNLDGCDASFVNALSDSWTFNYDGANALFGGQYQNPNDRIANVTLICDPSATTLTPKDPNVNAHPSQGGAVWVFDIVLSSNAVCGGPVPPPTQPTPPPPSPTPPPAPTGIMVATFSGLFCTGSGVKSYITPGCVASGASGSVLSICSGDGSTLQQLYFSNSTVCDGDSSMTQATSVNQCVNTAILQGMSTQLLSCSTPNLE